MFSVFLKGFFPCFCILSGEAESCQKSFSFLFAEVILVSGKLYLLFCLFIFGCSHKCMPCPSWLWGRTIFSDFPIFDFKTYKETQQWIVFKKKVIFKSYVLQICFQIPLEFNPVLTKYLCAGCAWSWLSKYSCISCCSWKHDINAVSYQHKVKYQTKIKVTMSIFF